MAGLEDRLSILPDELLHKIFGRFSMREVIQTSVSSKRWKLLWTTMPYLNLTYREFFSLALFEVFLNKLFSGRSNRAEVRVVNLEVCCSASIVFVRKVANYAISHNVQSFSVQCVPPGFHELPSSLFASQSLKHISIKTIITPCSLPNVTWDFPALTSLHISQITITRDENSTDSCLNIFSKCVNLKVLNLDRFIILGFGSLNLSASNLTTLSITKGLNSVVVVNAVVPKLVSLKISDCPTTYVVSAPSLSCFSYEGRRPLQLHADGFPSLGQAELHLSVPSPLSKEYACQILGLLHEFRSAKFLLLHSDVIKCLSTYTDLLSSQPSPFTNLKCLKIEKVLRRRISDDSLVRNYLYDRSPTMAYQVRKYLLGSSPEAIIILESPQELQQEVNKLEHQLHLMEEQSWDELGQFGGDKRCLTNGQLF